MTEASIHDLQQNGDKFCSRFYDICILIKISLMCVPKCLIDIESSLVQVTAQP